MAMFHVDFEKYAQFADGLEKDLVAIHGQAKAERLFRRMDRAQFQAFCEAASTDSIKRRWLERIETGYAHALSESRDAA